MLAREIGQYIALKISSWLPLWGTSTTWSDSWKAQQCYGLIEVGGGWQGLQILDTSLLTSEMVDSVLRNVS